MTLRDRICALREFLTEGGGITKCPETLWEALNYYKYMGQQVLESARGLWNVGWHEDLPYDLGELWQKWYSPAVDPLTIEDPLLTSIVGLWHEHLSHSIGDFCEEDAPRKVLCGFNVVNDLIFYLGSEDKFQALWEKWGSPAPGRSSKEPKNLSEVLTCLIEILSDPAKQGKFRVNPDTLGDILQGAQQAGLEDDRFVGGAAANNAYVLGHMGVEVHLHCPYHSNRLNWGEMASTVHYVELDGNGYNLSTINPGQPDLPTRTTVGFQSLPGWQMDQLGIQVKEPGRSLFIGGDPASSPRPWNSVRVFWGQSERGKLWKGRWQNNPEVWPYPTVFGNPTVQGQILQIRPVERSVIIRWAKQETYDVALLRDVGYRPGHGALLQARKEQLDALRLAGVPIHVEVSPGFDFALLQHLIAGSPYKRSRRWSVALNADELLETTHSKDPYLFPGRPPRKPELFRESLLQRFARAQHLMNRLSCDWIYVHGNELDLAVWRPEACPRGRRTTFGKRLRDAMLLAKAAVVAAMIERTPHERLRHHVTDQLQRGPALAVKGFWALINFAEEFSEWAAARYGLQKQKDDMCQVLLKEGFYELKEFGVAVAPVFWPSAIQNLNATGAGDYSSAVVAAYVWK